jgi:tRNA pseudouridine38-40 synthase
MRTLRLVIEYDGSGYCGWQRQRGSAAEGRPSVQATLEGAVRAVAGDAVDLVGAGRTDAGVHAWGQAAHLRTESRIPAARFPAALNAHLPSDIRVLHAEDASEGFHARYDALARTYAYEVLNRSASSALLRARAYHVPQPLDVPAMQRALRPFTGQHDFVAYRGAGSPTRTTLCAVTEAEWRARGERLRLVITADRFLRHMVRMLVGTLLRVGMGKLREADPAAFLADPDNRRTGPLAPAHALYLVQVAYPPGDVHAHTPRTDRP